MRPAHPPYGGIMSPKIAFRDRSRRDKTLDAFGQLGGLGALGLPSSARQISGHFQPIRRNAGGAIDLRPQRAILVASSGARPTWSPRLLTGSSVGSFPLRSRVSGPASLHGCTGLPPSTATDCLAPRGKSVWRLPVAAKLRALVAVTVPSPYVGAGNIARAAIVLVHCRGRILPPSTPRVRLTPCSCDAAAVMAVPLRWTTFPRMY
jgi:hypothetical protein